MSDQQAGIPVDVDPSLELRPELAEVVARLRTFVATVRWQFAKTMPQWPHWYTVLKWRPDLHDEMVWFAGRIWEHGPVEPWGPYRHHYLYLDGFKYWSMDPTPEATDLINRAPVSSDEGGSAEAEAIRP